MVKFVEQPATRVPIRECPDVLVVGGGSAGNSAALAAANSGALVVIVERYGFLGGAASAANLGTLCGFASKRDATELNWMGGISGSRMLTHLKELGGLGDAITLNDQKTVVFPYDPQLLRLAWDHLVGEKNTLRVYFHTWISDVILADDSIMTVIVESKGGRWAIQPKLIIDATGDGDVLDRAKATYCYDATKVQAASALFTVGGIAPEIYRFLHTHPIQELDASITGSVRPIPKPGQARCSLFSITSGTAGFDALDPSTLTWGEFEGRRKTLHQVSYLQTHVTGFQHAYLSELPVQLGIRETRRMIGQYVLSEDDVWRGQTFSDAVACGRWPIEIHDGQHIRWRWLNDDVPYYQIPWRSFVPHGLTNLFVVGRCFSATAVALSSARVVGTVMAMGEAVGVGALAHLESKGHDIDHIRSRIRTLRGGIPAGEPIPVAAGDWL